MKLVTGKWYKAIHVFEGETFFNYLFEIEPNIKFLAVVISDYVEYSLMSLDDFVEEIYNNYEFKEYRLNTEERRDILASAFN